MVRVLPAIMCLMLFLTGALVRLESTPQVMAQSGEIIVEGADYSSVITPEPSAGLVEVIGNVTSRMLMEYADFSSMPDLIRSADLDLTAESVPLRIIIEYADFGFEFGSYRSDELNQVGAQVGSRILVEYADFVFNPSFSVYKGALPPIPGPDSSPPVIGTPTQIPLPDDVPTYQNVTVWVNVTDTESNVKNVTLSYTTNNGTSWNELTMDRVTDYNVTSSTYQVVIPGQPLATLVRYHITAYDFAGNRATNDNNLAYFIYQVIPEFTQFLFAPLFMIATLLAVIAYKRKHCRTD